jgi:hypothetical protein
MSYQDPRRNGAAVEALLLLAVLLAVLVIVLSAKRASAAEPSAAPLPCQKSHELRMGEPAVCDGLLVPVPEAVRGGFCVRTELPRCRIDLGVARDELAAERKTCASLLEARDDTIAELLKLPGTVQAPPARKVPLVERPWFVATLSVVVTGAVAVVVVAVRDAVAP